MRIQSVNNTNNTNFGMAVTVSPKAKKMLEQHLTPKGVKQLKEIVSAEKSNPVNVNITTIPKFIGPITVPMNCWQRFDCFAVKADEKVFELGMMDIFSTSRAMISAIKKGVKHAHKIADTRKVLNEIPEKI